MKKYIIFAGVNGAGKSTLYHTNPLLFDMPRINLDEIVREFGSWKNPQDVMEAGKIAVKRLKTFIKEGVSFNQETTLCGKSIVRNMGKGFAFRLRKAMLYGRISCGSG